MKWTIKTMGCFVVALMMVFAVPALSAEAPSADSSTAASGSAKNSGFAGPGSVVGTMKQDRDTRAEVPTSALPTEKYFDFKKRIEDTCGFGVGFDYNALLQYRTESLGGDTAVGGVFRAFGQWTLNCGTTISQEGVRMLVLDPEAKIEGVA